MGLDMVEIVMEVEDRFGMTLPDEELSRCRTVGDFVDLVCAPSSFKTAGGAALCLAAKQPGPGIAARAEVTSRVRWIIAEQLAMAVEDVTVDTRWADLQ